MADSESWKELAEKFRAIQSRSSIALFLEWQRTYGARSELRWKPFHNVNRGRTLYLEFMLLAHEAGFAHDATSREPVRTWIEAIIQHDVANNPQNQRDPIGPESTPKGEVWHQPGRIHDLCAASIDLCLELQLAIVSRLSSTGRRSNPDPVKIRPEDLKVIHLGPSFEEQIEGEAQRQFHIINRLKELEAQSLSHMSPMEITDAALEVKQAVEQREAHADKTGAPCNRRSEVEAFLKTCNAISSERIYKRHIWLLAGHSQRQQFERWQRCSEDATGADETNFARIVATKADVFVADLQKKGLIYKGSK